MRRPLIILSFREQVVSLSADRAVYRIFLEAKSLDVIARCETRHPYS